jgi:hypothetical protein
MVRTQLQRRRRTTVQIWVLKVYHLFLRGLCNDAFESGHSLEAIAPRASVYLLLSPFLTPNLCEPYRTFRRRTEAFRSWSSSDRSLGSSQYRTEVGFRVRGSHGLRCPVKSTGAKSRCKVAGGSAVCSQSRSVGHFVRVCVADSLHDSSVVCQTLCDCLSFHHTHGSELATGDYRAKRTSFPFCGATT